MYAMPEYYDNSDGEICLVCGGLTKGLHFQVNACRACAAFYRRSVKSKLVYRCQRGTGRCDLKTRINGKALCRYCRMKKCAEIGMRLDSADLGHESTSSPLDKASTQYTVPQYEKSFTGSVVRIEGKRLIYDANPLIQTIKENLLKNTVNSFYGVAGVKLSPLQRMAHEVAKFISYHSPNIADVEVVSEIVSDNTMRFQEEYLLKLVHICTSCEDFVKLEDSQKFLMFRHFWGAFHNIERAYQTMMLFGHETTDTRFLIEYNKAIDIGRTRISVGDVDESELRKVFKPVKERMFCYLLNPMKALRPTLFEIAYIALNCLWVCVELTGITSDTYRISEEVLERSANELHNYYTYDIKLPNYAARHAALIRLITTTEALRRSRKDAFILAKFFNVIQFDFFECELEE